MPLFSRIPNVERLKAKRDLKGLIKALYYKSPRSKTIHEDAAIRHNAAAALAELHDPRSIAPLVASLRGGEMFNDELAVFRKLGDPAVDALIAALSDKDAQKRKMIVYMLGALKNARAVEPLIPKLRDDSSDVRRAAAIALMDLNDVRAVDPFIAALKDASADVRDVAAKSLGRLKDTRAVESLIAALEAARWEPISDIRSSIATALGELGDARALAPLMAFRESTASQLAESVPV